MRQKLCKCGCGTLVAKGRTYVSGHNLKGLIRTEKHNAAISAGQRKAWKTTRQRFPIGSKRKNHLGYVVVKITDEYNRWKLEHVIVAEAMLGRPVTTSEVVHHINGDRADNREENLFVCRDASHHNDVHRSEKAAMRTLLAAGRIVFMNGKYEAILQ